LGERHTGSVEVSGSNPLCSTRQNPHGSKACGFFAVFLKTKNEKGRHDRRPICYFGICALS
jgi:hypothetical protein